VIRLLALLPWVLPVQALTLEKSCWPKETFESIILGEKVYANPDLLVTIATDRLSGIVITQINTSQWWETWERKPDSSMVCIVRSGDGSWNKVHLNQ
jgi:hypothetical protein